MIPFIAYDLCEGCGACAELYPEVFVMRGDLA
jgi:ferredoxin